MEFALFFGIPVFFGVLQFFVTQSKLPCWKKYIPLVIVALTAAITWGACFNKIPLPQTYWFDSGGRFLIFPDYFFVGVFCIPALFGITLGAVIGVARPRKEANHE